MKQMHLMLLSDSSASDTQTLSKSFLIAYIIIAAFAAAGLIFLLVRDKKLAAAEETRRGIIVKVILYIICSVIIVAGLFYVIDAALQLYPKDASVSKENTEALLTAGFSVGYILPLLAIIKKRRAKGRGEKAPIRSTVFLIIGLPVFAFTLLAAILIA
ncbi:MAG: hypothetical protein IJ172_06200 [Ruminococcus sp.]|nr:hypothetical protein [Ruminococcus sp.]